MAKAVQHVALEAAVRASQAIAAVEARGLAVQIMIVVILVAVAVSQPARREVIMFARKQ